MSGIPRGFALYCLVVLALYGVAKYQGFTLFGAPTAAARGSGSYSSGASGSHK